MELTLHTGVMGEKTVIHIEWPDHNCVGQKTDLEIVMQAQDKPRALEVRINGVVLAVVPSR